MKATSRQDTARLHTLGACFNQLEAAALRLHAKAIAPERRRQVPLQDVRDGHCLVCDRRLIGEKSMHLRRCYIHRRFWPPTRSGSSVSAAVRSVNERELAELVANLPFKIRLSINPDERRRVTLCGHFSQTERLTLQWHANRQTGSLSKAIRSVNDDELAALIRRRRRHLAKWDR